MATLGQKNNNPLNIRFNTANNWNGQIGQNKGFCVFSEKKFGIRTGFKLLKNYNANGYNTIEKILHRFAPTTENNTESYINYVCKQTGFKGRREQRYLVAAPAAPASVRKQCEYATYFRGKSESARIE